MAGARAYECVYCHDLDRSHAINDVTKKKKGASNQTMPPAWAPAESENENSWCFFRAVCQRMQLPEYLP